ncbi:MAG: MotA/TolQ/ExbB proton channel family protein [Desulfobacterales bacterium]|jgi:biopolymer transport protein ExbB|nr:MotA/TolQ/ExbB proton channel family protein [Desulfobacterales bacterium]
MLDYFLKGGPVMYPLLLCSLIAFTFVIERIIFWVREEKRRNQNLVDEVLNFAEKGDYQKAAEMAGGCGDYVAKVLFSGLVHRDFSLTSAMEMAAAEETKRMKKYLSILDTMVTLSPLLGILGTVTGIIHSFELLGSTGIEHPEAVTAGIAEALITTAAGLIIAIPTLFSYNYFLSKTDDAILNMEKYGTDLEIVFEKNRSGVKSQ